MFLQPYQVGHYLALSKRVCHTIVRNKEDVFGGNQFLYFNKRELYKVRAIKPEELNTPYYVFINIIVFMAKNSLKIHLKFYLTITPTYFPKCSTITGFLSTDSQKCLNARLSLISSETKKHPFFRAFHRRGDAHILPI